MDRYHLLICAAPEKIYTSDGYKVLANAVRFYSWDGGSFYGAYQIVEMNEHQNKDPKCEEREEKRLEDDDRSEKSLGDISNEPKSTKTGERPKKRNKT